MKLYTKESLIQELKKFQKAAGLRMHASAIMGVLAIPWKTCWGFKKIIYAAEWELKTQRINTSSLVTLFHLEPSPRAIKFVPQLFLP